MDVDKYAYDAWNGCESEHKLQTEPACGWARDLGEESGQGLEKACGSPQRNERKQALRWVKTA